MLIRRKGDGKLGMGWKREKPKETSEHLSVHPTEPPYTEKCEEGERENSAFIEEPTFLLL